MLRFSCIFVGGWIATVAALGATVGESHQYVYHHENVLGTSLEFRVRAQDPAVAARAESAALQEIDRLAHIFSGYSPDSEFSRWQRTFDEPVPVSRELFAVLAQCDQWRLASHGAFNPTAETFSRLWKSAAAQGQVPSAIALSSDIARAGKLAWRLDTAAQTATHLSDCPLTLNAIAKGYIIEAASAVAWQGGGLEGLLLEIGGDLRVRGRFTESIALVDPRDAAENAVALGTVSVRDAALATSGNYRRGNVIQGRHYSHIIDPRTGETADQVLGANVIAADAMTADALSTTFSVLDPDASIRLADATPGVACLLTLADGRLVQSARWPQMAPQMVAAEEKAPRAQSDAPGTRFELAVDFELSRPDDERYRRPYVAVWIEDADAYPVRTILLWVLQTPKGARWIPDLRRWRRSDNTRRLVDDKDIVATVSGATRNPGKYTVVWDGNDDAGKPVKPGKYTCYVESAREHGPNSLVKHEFELGEQPFKVEVKGDEDIKGATLEYRRRTAGK